MIYANNKFGERQSRVISIVFKMIEIVRKYKAKLSD